MPADYCCFIFGDKPSDRVPAAAPAVSGEALETALLPHVLYAKTAELPLRTQFNPIKLSLAGGSRRFSSSHRCVQLTRLIKVPNRSYSPLVYRYTVAVGVPFQYTYLLADGTFMMLWLLLYAISPRTRREMVAMGIIIGLLSTGTAYLWWTIDWWHPMTITGTRVGIEDFIMGFASGGIIAAIYEIVFKKRYYTGSKKPHYLGSYTILIVLALITACVYGAGYTSFWAATTAMILTSALLYALRRDLFVNGLMSGVLMALASSVFYGSIILLSPGWIEATYDSHLSGILLAGVPIEEFVFWFLAGLVFGPFYEYWRGERLRRVLRRSA